MNSAPPAIPTLSMLFWNDRIFHRAVYFAGFALMVAVGFWWVSRPMPNAPPPSVDLSFEKAMAERIPPVALAVAALALLVAGLRYLRVRKVFTEGSLIRGTVQELKSESFQTTANVDQSHGTKYRTVHSYYITLRYTAQGVERTVRQKLPNSGFTFGLREGGEVELMVLDSKPDRPYIRAVYLRPSLKARR